MLHESAGVSALHADEHAARGGREINLVGPIVVNSTPEKPPSDDDFLVDIEYDLGDDYFGVTATFDTGFGTDVFQTTTFNLPGGGLDSLTFGLTDGIYSGSLTFSVGGGITETFSGSFSKGVDLSASLTLSSDNFSATLSFSYDF